MTAISADARSLSAPGETYAEPSGCGLSVAYTVNGGDGSAQNPYRVTAEAVNTSAEPWRGVLRFSLAVRGENPRFFLPAFLYGRNRGEEERQPGSKLNPRLHPERTELPYSPYFMTRADRLSHPAAMVFCGGRVLGISSSPYRVRGERRFWEPGVPGEFEGFNGFFCSVGEVSRVGFTVGSEDAPYKYIDAGETEPRSFSAGQCVLLGVGETLRVPLFVYDFASEEERGIAGIVRDVFFRYHQSPRAGASVREAARDLASAIAADAWMPDLHNYATLVGLKDGVTEQRRHTSIAWTAGAEIAAPLLLAAHRLGRCELREQALDCIDHIVSCSMNPASGLPFETNNDGVWSIDAWWQSLLPRRGHTAYVVGEAVWYILQAYDTERRRFQTEHADWLKFARRVVARMDETRDGCGEYPWLWSEETGEALAYDSFAGCWCAAAKALLASLTGDRELLLSCLPSEACYFDRYVRHMECYATPMDTFRAVDSEGILAFIRLASLLHRETGDPVLLDHLRTAMEYEFTFKFCWNVPIQTPPLSRLGWSSSGGSVTSTANHHIHPMSNGVLAELLSLARLTGDEYFALRFRDTLAWGLQTYNRFDGEYDFGKKGWMSERFCYSEGLLLDRYPDGSRASTWFLFLPWGAANLLEGMCGTVWDELPAETAD